MLESASEREQLLQKLRNGDRKVLARGISLVENEKDGHDLLMRSLSSDKLARIIGITGPPGGGKSTLTDALIEQIVRSNKKVAVLCIDPTSPFNFGALLGDRIRMSDWYTHPSVFIRSLATRGALGGLNFKVIEISDLVKEAQFDYVIVETVGVGQSEVDIAGLADITLVVLVPEAGDEVQTMKSGLMEIADVFVVNKSDRPGADLFAANLRQLVSGSKKEIPVIKTIAAEKHGIGDLFREIEKALDLSQQPERKYWLLAERAHYLINQKRMAGLPKEFLKNEISRLDGQGRFNLYQFVANY